MDELNVELNNSLKSSKQCNQLSSVSKRLFSANINGVVTEFVLIKYSNLIFITVSQCKKISNLHTICLTSSPLNSGIVTSRGAEIYDIKCIFGADIEEKTLAVRALAEKLHIFGNILLSLSVPDLTFSNILAISEAIIKNKCW